MAMIKAARHVPTTYQTPSNKDVGGKLLVENYNDYMSDMTAKLLIDAADFGLTVFGDGATIVKCPLTNILFAGEIFCVTCCLLCCCWQFHKICFITNVLTGGYEYQVLMDVVDSSKHMAEGGIKDAEYLAKQIIPVMLRANPQRVLFNMAVFDGAGNVQKGGQAIGARFPHVITIHGGEHVCSLFVGKVFQEPCMILLKNFTAIVSFSFLC